MTEIPNLALYLAEKYGITINGREAHVDNKARI